VTSESKEVRLNTKISFVRPVSIEGPEAPLRLVLLEVSHLSLPLQLKNMLRKNGRWPYRGLKSRSESNTNVSFFQFVVCAPLKEVCTALLFSLFSSALTLESLSGTSKQALADQHSSEMQQRSSHMLFIYMTTS